MYTGDSSYTLKHAEYTAGRMLGKVFKTQEELANETYVGFYIPKILPLMDSTQGPLEADESIDSSIFANNSETKPTIPSTIHIVNYIKCKYNGYSNFSQPIIALCETADIYFFDGNYRYPRYTNAYPDERKRKTDTVEWFVYGKPDVDDIPSDKYRVLLSTKDNKINIHTSKENGEEFVYDFTIDTKACTVEITDDKNNHMLIETKKKRVLSENETGTYSEIIDRDINHYCPGNYSIECDTYKLNAKTSIKREAGSKIDDTAPAVTINGTAKIDLVTPTLFANVSAQFKSVAPMNKFTVLADINSIIIQTAFLSKAPASIFQGLVKAKMFIIAPF
jgi:hypothetical protein